MADRIENEVDTRTYTGMINFLKWGAVASALLVALVIWLIAN